MTFNATVYAKMLVVFYQWWPKRHETPLQRFATRELIRAMRKVRDR